MFWAPSVAVKMPFLGNAYEGPSCKFEKASERLVESAIGLNVTSAVFGVGSGLVFVTS